MPSPAEHQFFVRHDLAIGPNSFMVPAVIGIEADAESSADPRVDISLHRASFDLRRPEPPGYFFRVGPRGVDFRRRGNETTFEGEARSGDETGVAGST